MSEAEVAYRAAIDKLMVEPNPHRSEEHTSELQSH